MTANAETGCGDVSRARLARLGCADGNGLSTPLIVGPPSVAGCTIANRSNCATCVSGCDAEDLVEIKVAGADEREVAEGRDIVGNGDETDGARACDVGGWSNAPGADDDGGTESGNAELLVTARSGAGDKVSCSSSACVRYSGTGGGACRSVSVRAPTPRALRGARFDGR